MTSQNGSLFVARCGLAAVALCHWESAPCISEDMAKEALRAHVAGHPHGDLVTFAAAHMETIVKYHREAC